MHAHDTACGETFHRIGVCPRCRDRDGRRLDRAVCARCRAFGCCVLHKIIVTAGLAEIVAGAIAMGLGGYLAARTDQEHYQSEERREYGEPPRARSSGSGDNLQGLWPRRRRVAAHCGRDHQQSSAVGRFHDAVRTRPRTSRSYAGSYQCSNCSGDREAQDVLALITRFP